MFPMNPMMQVLSQVRQIKQNPNQLASLLQQRGMISPQQAQEIQRMGGHYEQIGHYLMNQGRMPNDISQYKDQVQQVQNMMNQ